MRKAKNFVMVFLALLPILWILLVCSTGIMAERKPIDQYRFGSVLVNDGVISYSSGSPCEAVLSCFIPSGTAVSDLTGVLKACFNLATLLSSGSTAFLLGVGTAPNAAILVSLLYLFYLAVLELLNLSVSLIVLPVRLCSRWIDSVG